jgi:hypothetical protein
VKNFYALTRSLHLYLGMFLSPFVLAFAVSVFLLTHSFLSAAGVAVISHAANLPIPPGLDSLNGRARVEALRPVLEAASVRGEIWSVRSIPKEGRLQLRVIVPGRETTVDIALAAATAEITRRTTGVWDGLVTLHKLPGPHLADIRGNWVFIRLWSWLADATVYGVLFLSLSGLLLWYTIRDARRSGLALLALGAVSFLGIIYALSL